MNNSLGYRIRWMLSQEQAAGLSFMELALSETLSGEYRLANKRMRQFMGLKTANLNLGGGIVYEWISDGLTLHLIIFSFTAPVYGRLLLSQQTSLLVFNSLSHFFESFSIHETMHVCCSHQRIDWQPVNFFSGLAIFTA